MIEIFDLPYGFFEACCYLICLPSSTCLIDPCVSPKQLPAGIQPIRWLIATHGHFDHINQADALRQSTEAPVYIHAADADCLTNSQRNLSAAIQRSTTLKPSDYFLADGQDLPLTDNCHLEVMHTPGHTAGGICLILFEGEKPIALFTGDTLFAGSIGRLDLDGNQENMKESLARLQQLGQRFSDQMIPVYPGHGSKTELHREISENPYFQIFR